MTTLPPALLTAMLSPQASAMAPAATVTAEDAPTCAPLPHRGQVTLVGAGPGDPELLTLKAVRAIGAATLLLVDDLVSDAVLQFASPTARIVHVGKRGGCVSTPQAFIEKLMLQAAQNGEQVVRLKGGDPLIFGRGGEEQAHLQAAGIPVTVINGITAGLAAATALGVSLTHRDHAQGVVFLTGHAQGEAAPDWSALARTAAELHLTLVIYMGVTHAAALQQQLLCHLPPATPVAVVSRASQPGERQCITQLDDLSAAVTREGLGSPAVIVVGNVLQGLVRWAEGGAQPAAESVATGEPRPAVAAG